MISGFVGKPPDVRGAELRTSLHVPFLLVSNGKQLFSPSDSGIIPSFPKEIKANRFTRESVPPVITTSHSPFRIESEASAMACVEETQAVKIDF